jgi:uncharacterized protein (UPF0264 family)
MLHGLKARRTPAFLASVTSAEEARIALAGGAELIDAKDPARGALGALSPSLISAIVKAAAGRALVSATIGDLPANPAIVVPAAQATAGAGVDIVKAGFFSREGMAETIAALGGAGLGRVRLAAVLMAGRVSELEFMAQFAQAGFSVVMLDTADKSAGALTQVLAPARLKAFVQSAHAHGLVAGLAGSLRIEDIAGLASLEPDILGFRGALCAGGRTAALSEARVRAVKLALQNEARGGTSPGDAGAGEVRA